MRMAFFIQLARFTGFQVDAWLPLLAFTGFHGFSWVLAGFTGFQVDGWIL